MAELSDAELIAQTRSGDKDAYAELFRRYRDEAFRTAKWATRSNALDPEDLVSSAYLKVFEQLQKSESGPAENFLPYLRAVIRNDAIALTGRTLHTTQLTEQSEPVVPPDEGLPDALMIRDAFQSLPKRWREVLWAAEVEGLKPTEIAAQLGMRANAVSAVLYRARDGLKTAYVQEHVQSTRVTDVDCRRARRKLGPYVRQASSGRDAKLLHTHLEHCQSCAAIATELTVVTRQLAAFVPAAILTTAGAWALAGKFGAASVAATAGAATRNFSWNAVKVIGIPSGVTAAVMAVAAVVAIQPTSQDSSIPQGPIASPNTSVSASEPPATEIAATPAPETTFEPIPPDYSPEPQAVPEQLNLQYLIPSGTPAECVGVWTALVSSAGEMLKVRALDVPMSDGAQWSVSRANGALVGFSDTTVVNTCAPWWAQMR